MMAYIWLHRIPAHLQGHLYIPKQKGWNVTRLTRLLMKLSLLDSLVKLFRE